MSEQDWDAEAEAMAEQVAARPARPAPRRDRGAASPGVGRLRQ